MPKKSVWHAQVQSWAECSMLCCSHTYLHRLFQSVKRTQTLTWLLYMPACSKLENVYHKQAHPQKASGKWPSPLIILFACCPFTSCLSSCFQQYSPSVIEVDDRQVCTCWCAGRHLSQLPVDAGVGKLLVLGAALGCLSTCLTVAACLSYRTPFASSQDQQDAAGRVRQAMAAPGAFPVVRMPYYPLLCTLYGLACMEFKTPYVYLSPKSQMFATLLRLGTLFCSVV